MTEIRLTIELPAELADVAQRAGLLSSQSLADLLRAELERRRIDHLFDVADHLAAQEIPAMTAAEIEADIEAARAVRRTHKAQNATLSAKPLI